MKNIDVYKRQVYNSAIAWVGGLAGNGNKIYSSYATGNIYTDANYVGGIIGNTNSSKIQNCSVSNMKVNSTVEAGDLDVGGIVGNNNGSIIDVYKRQI